MYPASDSDGRIGASDSVGIFGIYCTLGHERNLIKSRNRLKNQPNHEPGRCVSNFDKVQPNRMKVYIRKGMYIIFETESEPITNGIEVT